MVLVLAVYTSSYFYYEHYDLVFFFFFTVFVGRRGNL